MWKSHLNKYQTANIFFKKFTLWKVMGKDILKATRIYVIYKGKAS